MGTGVFIIATVSQLQLEQPLITFRKKQPRLPCGNTQNRKESHMRSRAVRAALMAVLFSCPALADRRPYVWTYTYQTMPRGQAELEFYTTMKIPDRRETHINRLDYEAELEFGITDRWDISFYQRWRQTNAPDDHHFHSKGFKLRTRYRFGERGLYLVDVLLYAEYVQAKNEFDEEVELKLILSKDIGKWNVSLNPIWERRIDTHGPSQWKLALGVSRQLSPAWILGFEVVANLTEHHYAFGPTVSWATEKFWVTFGLLSGLHHRADDIEARVILGLSLW